jgi:hypothetical protein
LFEKGHFLLHHKKDMLYWKKKKKEKKRVIFKFKLLTILIQNNNNNKKTYVSAPQFPFNGAPLIKHVEFKQIDVCPVHSSSLCC